MDYGNLAALPDGVYHDMPDETYHAIPRLSASGVKNLLVSPMTFWSRSWMNKERDNEGPHFDLGKAYHARILEGREVFEKRFAFELDPADHVEALAKGDDYKAWIRAHNEATGDKVKLSGTNAELIKSILEIDPNVPILDVIRKAHYDANPGKTFLSSEWRTVIERDAAFIEKHPTISACFKGGEPEVTILWTHDVETQHGSGEIMSVPMKTRVDRLKAEAIIDLKTYTNTLDKTLTRALAGEVATRRYHLQAAVYYRAIDFAVQKGWIPRCGAVSDTALNPEDDGRQFVFVFQCKGDDPTPHARVMSRQLQWIDHAMREFDNAALTFAAFTKSHGEEPWMVNTQLEYFADEDFPLWMSS